MEIQLYEPEIPMPVPKTLLRAAGVVLRIDAITEDAKLWLTDVASTQCKTCDWSQLQAAMRQGIVSIVDETAAVQALLVPVHLRAQEQRLIEDIPAAFRTEKALAVMLTKRRWILELERQGVKNFNPSPFLREVIRDVEHKLQEKCPYGLDAIYLAARTLRRNGGDHRSLLPQFHRRGGPGSHRLDSAVDRIIAQALDDAENPASGKLRPVKIHRAVEVMVRTHNAASAQALISTPSLPTITRRFNERFDPYVVCVRNEGKKRADQIFRETGSRIRVDQALDVVHYDDTDTATFLVDDRTGLPWGRAWLTAGVDENTAAVLGCALSERARSSESALEAVIHGIFPKDHNRPEFAKCRGKWEWYGQPGIVNLDNASYNATLQFQASVLEFDTEVAFARPHQPTDKSDIEHFNSRVKSEFIHDLPGWVGPKEDREMLDVGLGSAVMTLDDFRQRLFAWIVDEYSNKPCGKFGKTPREAWREQFQELPPLLPRKRPSQELMGTIFQKLTFRDSGGLLRMRLHYWSQDLADLRKKMGANAEVMLRYLPSSLAFLYVLNPFTKNYLKVPCTDDARYVEGLTNYQQSLVLKKARLMKMRAPGLTEMYKARQALISDTKELLSSKKLRQRKLGYQIHRSGLTDVSGVQPESSAVHKLETKFREVMVSAVEDMVTDVDEVELEMDEEMELE